MGEALGCSRKRPEGGVTAGVKQEHTGDKERNKDRAGHTAGARLPGLSVRCA